MDKKTNSLERSWEVKAERDYRQTVVAIAFVMGLLVGMLVQSVLFTHLDSRAHQYVKSVTSE